jgi:hypothetical protein
LEASGFNNGINSVGKNFSVGLFNLLNNPYRKIELPMLGRFEIHNLIAKKIINFSEFQLVRSTRRNLRNKLRN